MSIALPDRPNRTTTTTLTHRTRPVGTPGLTAPAIKSAVARTRRLIAPLWPLQHFVAVNPFLGLADKPFADAAAVLGQRAGARLTAPRAFYADALRDGRITPADLAAALDAAPDLPGAPHDIETLRAHALRPAAPADAVDVLPTVADTVRAVTGEAWDTYVTDAISRWAAAYFDKGQAYWSSPWRDLPPFAAWRAEAAHDRSPEIAGLRGFRRWVQGLPSSPQETIEACLRRLEVPAAALDAYLHRLLLTIGGWAGYARYKLWEAELRDGADTTIDDLLAIRLVWEAALLETFGRRGVTSAWAADVAKHVAKPVLSAEAAADLLLHIAFENGIQRRLAAQLDGSATRPAAPARPAVQAAFCIDVRSEVFRRALEAAGDDIETIGFAGFFGFPIEYVRLGDDRGGAQCPALIAPQFTIKETVDGLDAAGVSETAAGRIMHRRVAKAWRSFKFGAVSCFGFVGPVGLAYLRKLVTDSLYWTRPVEKPSAFGLDAATAKRLGPTLAAAGSTGMTPEQRLETAAGMLRAMSLTDNFARLVVLAGHGSTTVNNPYASGLDCGACGGHTGEANARVAAQVLNDPVVRAGLAERGIAIPDDTVFVAALHDTTTDAVTLFDRHVIPASHAADLSRLEAQLAAAGRTARAERAPRLGIGAAEDVDVAVQTRSRDWSQVRPEWGLAGCSAFIVAPRDQTAALDLEGRAFLHSYAWRQDADFSVLELIMTAPMVVTAWINLQYFASAVDNERFGSGNKVLHNITGTLGVLEGNGGDLRTGLPWQSVHDGTRFVHEPARLNVCIAAPTDAMTAIIERHADLRHLLDNQWLHLFALDDDGRMMHRYAGDLTWTAV